MKATVLSGVIVVSIVLVAVLAGYLWLGRKSGAERRLAESVNRSERVYRLYFGSADGEAKRAILDHLDFLDEMSRESADPAHNPFAVDAMLWCVRMARLEERRNGLAGSQYLRDALGRCQRLGWADCSEEALRHQVERMDTIALAALNRE